MYPGSQRIAQESHEFRSSRVVGTRVVLTALSRRIEIVIHHHVTHKVGEHHIAHHKVSVSTPCNHLNLDLDNISNPTYAEYSSREIPMSRLSFCTSSYLCHLPFKKTLHMLINLKVPQSDRPRRNTVSAGQPRPRVGILTRHWGLGRRSAGALRIVSRATMDKFVSDRCHRQGSSQPRRDGQSQVRSVNVLASKAGVE